MIVDGDRGQVAISRWVEMSSSDRGQARLARLRGRGARENPPDSAIELSETIGARVYVCPQFAHDRIHCVLLYGRAHDFSVLDVKFLSLASICSRARCEQVQMEQELKNEMEERLCHAEKMTALECRMLVAREDGVARQSRGRRGARAEHATGALIAGRIHVQPVPFGRRRALALSHRAAPPVPADTRGRGARVAARAAAPHCVVSLRKRTSAARSMIGLMWRRTHCLYAARSPPWVSVSDVANRPPRALADGEEVDLGQHRLTWLATPHLPHGMECGYFFDERTGTLSMRRSLHAARQPRSRRDGVIGPRVGVERGDEEVVSLREPS